MNYIYGFFMFIFVFLVLFLDGLFKSRFIVVFGWEKQIFMILLLIYNYINIGFGFGGE